METLMAQTPETLRAGFELRSAVRDEHNQLSYFEGEWTNSIKVWLDSDSTPLEGKGTTVVEPAHGGRHYVLTDQGKVGGTAYTSSSTMGFDNVREEFVTTTMDSLQTGVLVAHGNFDPDENAYIFYADVPSLKTPGGIRRVRVVRRIVDKNHFVFEWYEMRGGKEVKTIQNEFTRESPYTDHSDSKGQMPAGEMSPLAADSKG